MTPFKNDAILLKGVRTHNLKNIDVRIPYGTFSVVTGVSGSGKSSLAFDTLYAEGRRRYVESLSTYSRQFLERIEKPDLDFVSGILPAIAIEAKNVVSNARSTVGTQTELNDYLRLLFARIGKTHCLSCGKLVSHDTAFSAYQAVSKAHANEDVTIAFPVTLGRSGETFKNEMIAEFERQGFLHFIVSGNRCGLDPLAVALKKDCKSILVIVDELKFTRENQGRSLESIESAFKLGKGEILVLAGAKPHQSEYRFSDRFQCSSCKISYRLPTPNSFSFNSPLGACPECQGFGRIITIDWNLVVPDPRRSITEGAVEPWTKPSCKREFRQLKEFCRKKHIPLDVQFSDLKPESKQWILNGLKESGYFSVQDFFDFLQKKTYKMHVRIFLSKYRGYLVCSKCKGARLKPEALCVRVGEKNIAELSRNTIDSLKHFFDALQLSEHELAVSESILIEIKNRLSFLWEVGLGYLTLERPSRTLSGGEAQRIHLAASLGSSLVDTLYVLDEPSIGLHERDNGLLIRLLKKLKSLGNTIVVVEHDREMIEASDQVIDLGPLGGERGGEVIFFGPFSEIRSSKKSHTAEYFRGELSVKRRYLGTNGKKRKKTLSIYKASEHNLKHISLEIPLHQLVVITGVSGSGKSTLMYDVLYANYERWRGRRAPEVGAVKKISGWDQVHDLVLIDQSPIGRSPRSNPVTYIKAFDHIRTLFSRTREAKLHGLGPGYFSFNVPGGRCEKCKGDGVEKIEMHFLADISITCESCGGSRYQARTLEIRYRGKNIRDVLNMTIQEAAEFFKDEDKIREPLFLLSAVGLGYLRLGQAATTLSGGEAQRLKLAAELSQATNENLLYLFDEPTTGLHYYDIVSLLRAFEALLEKGHSVCVIEHNMEIIKCADHIIDLGPEGGDEGGNVVYQGSLDGLMQTASSHTGVALKKYMEKIR